MSVALVTGGSAGLGRALVLHLAARGWSVVTDARHGPALLDLPEPAVVRVVGDVDDPRHRATLHREIDRLGGLDLLVHNASSLGPVPLRAWSETDADDVAGVWRTNLDAPLRLTLALLPLLLASDGILVSISSDAAVAHYEGWGAYGASKAALDHVTLTLGAENPRLAAYAVDPGDMRTAMHQAAFPGEDISDRPAPETVVPHLLGLLEQRPASGRYRIEDLRAARQEVRA